MTALDKRLLASLDARLHEEKRQRDEAQTIALRAVEAARQRAYAALAELDYPATRALERLVYDGEAIAVWKVIDAYEDYGIVAFLSASGLLFYNNSGSVYLYTYRSPHGSVFSTELHESVAVALDRLVERGFNLPADGRYV